ncbi:DUF159-domain-containing protein [Trichocladium antarcticum]|uniref:DUF159-domain-containing protein n=1 Tax=Trichocladium antarcticum TaxID=1450529 RepID=A0AAN6UJV2_9PEZI|nr:DUF159-domain-containing protein [Trichocladium antarcticum]
MCGRYAMALRPSQVRQMLQDNGMPVDDAPPDDGPGAPRQTHNFAPGNHGIIYRADVVPARAARPTPAAHANMPDDEPEPEPEPEPKPNKEQHAADDGHDGQPPRYRLQSMQWGLVPSWSAHRRRAASVSSPARNRRKPINCRDDSLAAAAGGGGGMWASMRARKRCVVLAQGFYEWRAAGPGGSAKVPYFVRRRDGAVMWEGEGEGEAGELYTYAIVTTGSCERLRFLHDRMPVVLEPGSRGMAVWLDPRRTEWGRELQAVLRPYDGELEVYPVPAEVGKVGNDSPAFVVPVASRENKANIANFFVRAGTGKGEAELTTAPVSGRGVDAAAETAEGLGGTVASGETGSPVMGIKRAADPPPAKGEPPAKKAASAKGGGKISATRNVARSPGKAKGKAAGSHKITKFFGNSA